MKLFWIANIVFFAFLEIYSIGVMFAAKKCGERYLKCLIPFYAMYCVGHMVKNFSIMTIPVQKFHKMFLTLYLMAAGALLYACWGQNNLPADNTLYWRENTYQVEYYFKTKDESKEAEIEEILLADGYNFEKSEDIYIEEEGLFVIYYYI